MGRSLGIGPGLSDVELRSIFDGFSDGGNVAGGGIPVANIARRLAVADGAHPFGVNTDPISPVLELYMLWTVRKFDANRDDLISFEEFVNAVRETECEILEADFFSEKALALLDIPSFSEDVLRKKFRLHDKDKNGAWDAAEVEALFQNISPTLSRTASFKEMVAGVVKRLDTDGDSVVSWEEFRSAFILVQEGNGWRDYPLQH